MMPKAARQNLSLPQQFLFLQKSKTAVGQGFQNPQSLEWHFVAQPTPLSRSYDVRLVLQKNGTPDVSVLEPNLSILAAGRELPHIYHHPDRQCLYMPGTGQWDASKRLDLTIVPWTHLWLLYFEDWLATNEWKGGGKHPGEEEEDEDEGNRALRRSLRRSRKVLAN
jgi:hypothetical protein